MNFRLLHYPGTWQTQKLILPEKDNTIKSQITPIYNIAKSTSSTQWKVTRKLEIYITRKKITQSGKSVETKARNRSRKSPDTDGIWWYKTQTVK